MRRLGLFLAAWVVAFTASADEWIQGRVVGVHDGDTATVTTRDGHLLQVRFYGIDAPEVANEHWPAQAYGREAARYARKLLLKREVKVRLTGETTYRREVGEIFIDDNSASQTLVRAGLAWWNTRYAPRDHDLQRLESAARQRQIGLWQGRHPVPPWVYRRQHKSRTP